MTHTCPTCGSTLTDTDQVEQVRVALANLDRAVNAAVRFFGIGQPARFVGTPRRNIAPTNVADDN